MKISEILKTTPNLATLVKNPKSVAAKAVAMKLRPFCRKLSQGIPFGKQSGSAQMTISINYGRFFGNGIFFKTLNPSVIKQPFFVRLLNPLVSNNAISNADINAQINAYESLSLSERKILQIAILCVGFSQLFMLL